MPATLEQHGLTFRTHVGKITGGDLTARSVPHSKWWIITDLNGLELVADPNNPTMTELLVERLQTVHNQDCKPCQDRNHNPRVLLSPLEILRLYCEGALSCFGALFWAGDTGELRGRFVPREQSQRPVRVILADGVERFVHFRVRQDATTGALETDHVK